LAAPSGFLGASSPSGGNQSESHILDLVTNAEEKVRRLVAKLENCRAAGHDVAYPDAAVAVAELFCRFSRYDATQPGLRVSHSIDAYVDQMLAAELHIADEVLAGRTNYPVIPPWRSAVGVIWHDGSFRSGGQPIFLSGFNWDATEARHYAALLKTHFPFLKSEEGPDFPRAFFHFLISASWLRLLAGQQI
jgi:hypothetical protein